LVVFGKNRSGFIPKLQMRTGMGAGRRLSMITTVQRVFVFGLASLTKTKFFLVVWCLS
jgi:hypothetical protein